MDLTASGMGVRSQRYSMLVDNGVVRALNVEQPGKFEVSDADTMLKSVWAAEAAGAAFQRGGRAGGTGRGARRARARPSRVTITPPAMIVVEASEFAVSLNTQGVAMKARPTSTVTTPMTRSTAIS